MPLILTLIINIINELLTEIDGDEYFQKENDSPVVEKSAWRVKRHFSKTLPLVQS